MFFLGKHGSHQIVIACGGGGIPVIEQQHVLKGASAVIEKDAIASKLAADLSCEELIILTDVDYVYKDFGARSQEPLPAMTVSQARELAAQGQFEAGTMLGGAFSNTYDRLKRKYVVDYVSFPVKNEKIRNVVFNISDFCIMIGALLMVLGSDDKHRGQRIGRPHGRQGIFPHKLPYNDGIHRSVELLEQITQDHGQSKEEQRPARFICKHVVFFHSAYPFVSLRTATSLRFPAPSALSVALTLGLTVLFVLTFSCKGSKTLKAGLAFLSFLSPDSEV